MNLSSLNNRYVPGNPVKTRVPVFFCPSGTKTVRIIPETNTVLKKSGRAEKRRYNMPSSALPHQPLYKFEERSRKR